MDLLIIYPIGLATTLFIGAFFMGLVMEEPIEDKHVRFLIVCSLYWPITVPLFGVPLALYLFFCAIYDLGHYLGKKLGGGK